MKRHADFLALLYLAWGAIFALVGLAGLALAGRRPRHRPVAAARCPSAPISPPASPPFTFGRIAVLALLLGRAAPLARRGAAPLPPWARLAALGLAVINLVLFPFGTALGGYALLGAADRRRPGAVHRECPGCLGCRRATCQCLACTRAPAPQALQARYAPWHLRRAQSAGGGSTVPIGVHGPQRRTRFIASQPPRTAPNWRMQASP